MSESIESASLYQLKNAEQKIVEIELAEQYIKDVLVAISGLAIDADKIDAVYAELDNIAIVSDNIADVIIVADDIAKVITCANNIADIVTVAGISVDVSTVAAIALNVTTVANNDANVTLVGDDLALGKGTNQPTDSSILNALDNAEIAKQAAASVGSLSSLSDVTITNPVANEAVVYNVGSGEWENGTVIGLPDEAGHFGKTVSNEGVTGDSSWRNIVSNPTNVKEDETMIANGMMVSPTIDDTMTVTVPDGQTLVIL